MDCTRNNLYDNDYSTWHCNLNLYPEQRGVKRKTPELPEKKCVQQHIFGYSMSELEKERVGIDPSISALNNLTKGINGLLSITQRISSICPFCTHPKGFLALIEAIKSRNLSLLYEILSDSTILITEQDKEGRNIFHHAALIGDFQFCQILFMQVVDLCFFTSLANALNTPDSFGFTPFRYAFENSASFARLFYVAGVNPSIKDYSNCSVEELAKSRNDFLFFYYLYEKNGQLAQIAETFSTMCEQILRYPNRHLPSKMCAALIWDKSIKTKENVHQLLLKKIVVKCPDGSISIPMLFVKVFQEKSALFRKLGSNEEEMILDQIDLQGFLTVLEALFAGDKDIRPLLPEIRKTASFSGFLDLLVDESLALERGPSHQNLLQRAIHTRNFSEFKMILDCMKQVDKTSLFSAFRNRILNECDHQGNTLLHRTGGNLWYFSLELLKAGANPFIKNSQGFTFVDMIKAQNHLLFLYDYHYVAQKEKLGTRINVYATLSEIFDQILKHSVEYTPALVCAAKVWEECRHLKHDAVHFIFNNVTVRCADGPMRIPRLFLNVLKEKSNLVKAFYKSEKNELILGSVTRHAFEGMLRLIFSSFDHFHAAQSALLNVERDMISLPLYYQLLLDEILLMEKALGHRNRFHWAAIDKNFYVCLLLLECVCIDERSFFSKDRWHALTAKDDFGLTPLDYISQHFNALEPAILQTEVVLRLKEHIKLFGKLE